ncbi:hypothetical protein ACJJIK_18295 [Microbulbifer sp. ZKSA006]
MDWLEDCDAELEDELDDELDDDELDDGGDGIACGCDWVCWLLHPPVKSAAKAIGNRAFDKQLWR